MALATYRWDEQELARLDLQASYSWHLLHPHLLAAGLKPGARVLDAGCGSGRVTARLAEAVGPQGEVVAVDIDPSLLAMAAAAPMSPQAAPVRWMQGDARALGADHAPYDMVVAQMLLQHLDDPAQAIAEFTRVVRPGGGVVLLDADDALIDAHPTPAGFRAFQDRVTALQAAKGGDREIGRRLAGLAHAAGLVDVVPAVQLFTAPPNPMAHFLAASLAFKHQLFPPDEQADALATLARFQADLSQPGAFGMIGVYAVRARRPQESA